MREKYELQMRLTAMALAISLCIPLSVLAEEWVDVGWQQINTGQYDKALATWQQGINQLDDQRLLASVGVYAHFPYAIDQLKQIGPAFDAFIIRREQNARLLYYVLSTRQVPTDRNSRQLVLADLKQAAGITDILIAVQAKDIKLNPVPTDYLSKTTMKPDRHITKPASILMATLPNIFSINRFEISGNQHISTDIILMNLSDFYGSGKTHADLELIKKQVLETYHMAKIYNVKIKTPHLIDDDTVHITIREKD